MTHILCSLIAFRRTKSNLFDDVHRTLTADLSVSIHSAAVERQWRRVRSEREWKRKQIKLFVQFTRPYILFYVFELRLPACHTHIVSSSSCLRCSQPTRHELRQPDIGDGTQGGLLCYFSAISFVIFHFSTVTVISQRMRKFVETPIKIIALEFYVRSHWAMASDVADVCVWAQCGGHECRIGHGTHLNTGRSSTGNIYNDLRTQHTVRVTSKPQPNASGPNPHFSHNFFQIFFFIILCVRIK